MLRLLYIAQKTFLNFLKLKFNITLDIYFTESKRYLVGEMKENIVEH